MKIRKKGGERFFQKKEKSKRKKKSKIPNLSQDLG